jgi:toxin ParE1/3/4
MAYKIVWSHDAGDELVEIISYYKYSAGKNIARNVYLKIKNRVKRLVDNPRIGKIVQTLKDIGMNDYRQLIETPWIIYYRIEKEMIFIISVIDGRRNIEEILYKKIIDGKIK